MKFIRINGSPVRKSKPWMFNPCNYRDSQKVNAPWNSFGYFSRSRLSTFLNSRLLTLSHPLNFFNPNLSACPISLCTIGRTPTWKKVVGSKMLRLCWKFSLHRFHTIIPVVRFAHRSEPYVDLEL